MPNTHETLTSLFSDIANSIRGKTGETRTLVADNFPAEIDAIPTGGQSEPLPPDTPYTWTRPSNYPDLDSLTYPNNVNEMYVTIDKTLDPSVTKIQLRADNGAFYFGHIENGEFVADTADIKGTIDLTQYSGDILLGKLVMGTFNQITNNKVFAESYVNVNNSSVTYISLFKGQNIKHINIKSLKTAATSMSMIFYNCYSLQQLDLSNFDTSSVTNMSSMFSNCEKLQQLDLSSFNTSSVTDMSKMFYFCRSLRNLDLSSFNTSSVTNMSDMFSECRSLSQLDLSSFNTSLVTDMSDMFNNCGSLQQLDLSNFNTSSVTNMSSMFFSCACLQNIDLSNLVTSSVTSMSSMFNGCGSLQNLDLSSFNTSVVTDMSSMFAECRSLSQLDLSNFDTSSVTNMSNMFYYGFALQNLDLSNFDTSSVTNMNWMFRGCDALKIAEPFQSTLTASQVTSLFDSDGLFNYSCIYRSTYLSWCEIIPEGTGTIDVSSLLNNRLSDADRTLLTNKGYTLTIH